ncbi:DUF4167 domain-containing protein [Bartonella rattimassiliensis]|uniref:DUF4167 domain-containing protein n=1 Tax=Bartonella rattimassiliensis 15908 TaxID=1094556 RepID=J0ZII3_9HYPH|nr:DUF4167 domain-containing protein [Bartonella rattimassiliensis]EJF88013.1 hypothetical protein MCY_00010 [Bartonella rattimassiliensis 15908]
MRPQQNRRVRGRNNNNNGNNNNNRRGPNPLSRNYESSGPDVKIRGNAQQIADKYISLARDAQGAGDRVMSENYLQHAEHYLRIILAATGQAAPSVRRDENRDENNEQECNETNAEGEKKEIVDSDTDAAQMQAPKNDNDQYAKAQNGDARENALEALTDEKTDQESCRSEKKVEPVKKTRRSPRRRTVLAQDEIPFELSLPTSESSSNGDASTSTGEGPSLSGISEGIQRKVRRRRVGASSAEENV